MVPYPLAAEEPLDPGDSGSDGNEIFDSPLPGGRGLITPGRVLVEK